MRWTKVRKLVHDSFADCVRARVRVDVTNADPRGASWQDTCKQGWILVDDAVIAHIDPHRLRRLTLTLPSSLKLDGKPQRILIVQPRPQHGVPSGAQAGEFLNLEEACWDYLQSKLSESLRSRDPFVSSLAVLNVKVGRTRLSRAATWDLHPLTRWMVEFRLRVEREARALPVTPSAR